MSQNGTASSNTGQTEPVREEERNLSEDATDDTNVTASTAAQTKKNTSAMDTQDAREGLRPMRPVSMPPMSQGGLVRYQTKQPFQ